MTRQKSGAGLYVTGGPVQIGGGIYVRRRADDELLRLCLEGNYAYVLAPRQVGKSSLMEGTIDALRRAHAHPVKIDLNVIGVEVKREEFYLGLLVDVQGQLPLSTDAYTWWQAHSHLGMAQRLTLFFKEVVLAQVPGRVVVFIDEIDSTLALDFADDLFAAIRSLYHDRRQTPEAQRLSFVLIGVATPGDLIKDRRRTPFNIGDRVDLNDFTFEEAKPLAAGLGLPPAEAEQMLGWVLAWTGGQPYLTQRLLRNAAERGQASWTSAEVDELVESTFLRDMTKDTHFVPIRDMLIDREMLRVRKVNPELILKVYLEVLRDERPVPDEERSRVKSHLKLAGVVRNEAGFLRPRNRVYREVFNEHWVEEQIRHLPVNWPKRLAYAAGVVVALLVLVAAGLAPYAWDQRNDAITERAKAEQQRAEAEQQRALAEANAREANRQRDEAERQRKLAEQSEAEAKRQAERAEEQTRIAQEQREKAEQQRLLAEKARREEEEARRAAVASAERERLAKENEQTQRAAAEAAKALAETNAAEAEKQRGIAEELKREAERERDKATSLRDKAELSKKEAEARKKEAEARRLAVQAELLTRQGPEQGPTSVLLAVESMNQQPSLEGDRALRVAVGALPTSAAAGLSPRLTPLPLGSPPLHLVYSPDGRYLAAVSEDGLFQLLEPDTFSSALAFTDKLKLSSVSFSPSGRFLVALHEDGGAFIYDLTPSTSGSSLTRGRAELEPPKGARINTVIFSPDETTLATRDDGGGVTLHVLVFASAALRPTFLGGASKPVEFEGDANDLTFSPDGKVLAVGTDVNTAHLFDVDSGRLISTLETEGDVLSLAFSPDGRFLATGGDAKHVKLWEVVTGRPLATLPAAGGDVTDITFTGNGRYMAAASGTKAIVWELRSASVTGAAPQRVGRRRPRAQAARLLRVGFQTESGQQAPPPVQVEQITIMNHGSNILSVKFSPDGQYLATVGEDSIVPLWNTTNGSVPAAALGHGGRVRDISFSPDGKSLATFGGNGGRVWNLVARRGSLSLPTLERDFAIQALAFDPTGEERLAVGSQHHTLLWSRLGGERPTVESVELGTKSGDVRVAFSADGKRMLSGLSGDGKVTVTELTASGRRRVAEIPAPDVRSVALSPDGKLAAVGGSTGLVILWQINDDGGTVFRLTLSGHTRSVNGMAFSPDGKRIATGGGDGLLIIWDAVKGVELFSKSYTGVVNAVAYSPNGEYLAAAGQDPDVHVLYADGFSEFTFERPVIHRGNVRALAFSPASDYLATAGGDGTVRVWEMSPRGRPVARLGGGPFNAVAFSGGSGRNGRLLATGGEDGEVRLWLWRKEELVTDACSRLNTTTLSPLEWEEYMEATLKQGEEPRPTCPAK